MFVEEFVIILNILYFCISLGIMCLNEQKYDSQLNLRRVMMKKT